MAPAKLSDEAPVKKKCCYTWTKLLLSACVPLAVAIFTVVYTLQQDKLNQFNREQDLKIAREKAEQDLKIARENGEKAASEQEKMRKQTVYDSYIAEISQMVRNRDFNISDVNQLTYIRIQTLNALQQLDHDQKRQVIVFLYEHSLIRADSPKSVNLRGADLTGVKFVRSTSFLCELNNLHLAEVLADNIIFDGCQLERSVFNRASLHRAKFLNSYVIYSSYQGAYMVRSVFNNTNTGNSNFASADLRNASFSSFTKDGNFTNTDLFGSNLPVSNLLSRNIIINTRFPNGSFSAIDTKQLVVNGGAEINMSKQAR
jgi:uncharacterized protein YjbI with pentapeptide repeats